MKIGSIEYRHGLFLAPMAGITDRPFRRICKRYGAEGLTTEMISSKAITFGDKKTSLLAEIGEDEKPCSLQLFGSEPETMARAAVLSLRFMPCAIDINMGCPAPKIAGSGDGSAIMKSPSLAYAIVLAMRKALDGEGACGIPITVKMRSGIDGAHINATEIALACEGAGAAAITVHGRTRKQMYAPPVNLDIIREVKSAVKVPVIGNGDIHSGADALYMMKYTGCDGVMIGRGALGNPYIFAEIIAALEGRACEKISADRWLSDVISHMTELIEEKGVDKGSCEARKHLAWYVRGIPGAADMRRRINTAKSLSDVIDIAREAAESYDKRDSLPTEFKVGNMV